MLEVRELEIDLIDRINPFQTARAILGKTMNEENLRRIAEVIAKKRINIPLDEARELAERAIRFRRENARLPSLTAADDPYERRMAEGVAVLQREAVRNV